ncbi:DUF2092 domain-containing protein [Paraburkholderia sp. Ac-20340]|uniref:DUF2092 domain-containing protein n=1 Tax=Paraburkholderia sp. Ac-20340 TaxID=2703888 RepID=UPI00198090CA|nr:DUF2092 domain-containing protein [Paraburkholderia sp. Ac-20340]MBN3858645.1 DUF2092 domain-containing protein [Paraburkholderia sp. Ac-20340]
MTQRLDRLAALAAVALTFCAAGEAAMAAKKVVAPAAATKPDPEALDALTRMSSFMETVKQFDLDVDSTTDQIMVNGATTQLIQLSHNTKLTVSRPDSLKVDIVGGAPGYSRHVFYNGKTFTLFTEPGNYYASAPAPATIKELMGDLENKYGIELPLSDIFTLGANPDDLKRVTSAVYIGDEVVSGNTCSHYAYRQNNLDWQIWIQKGSQPLPCKLNIVTSQDKERPQYTAIYHWNLKPEISAKLFDFSPPENAHQIKFVQTNGAQ